ncbi:rarD protein [Aristaeella hokkaidonensis]|nr:EamA family transporter [Aristaeella hokkaidonensis]SNT92751.1 rarD protein [Aristaeella hokkaidonensis]
MQRGDDMGDKTNDRRSVIMIVASMLIFGTIGLFRRYIPCSSAFLAFVRGILGGLLLLAFTRINKMSTGEKLPRQTVTWLAVSGAVIGINWMLLFEAYNHTTVAVATLCYYMQPTIVMLVSPLLFREKLTKRKAICAVIAVIGMVLVSGVTEGGGNGAGNLKGVLLGLGAAVCYASVIIMNKKITGVDAYRKTTIQLLCAGLVMVPYMLLTGGIDGAGFNTTAVILLLVVGVIHTGFAYVLYFGSMDGLKAQSIAMLSYIDPVTALLLSALVLREPLSAAGVVGAIMILFSAILAEKRINE